ncbi:MAG TPA: hypothetical protein DCR28_03870 [Eubacterium sp.]|nr:hypothetical protein [Eubacterium sp.]
MGKLKESFYKKRIYNNKLLQKFALISVKPVSLYDTMVDKKICGFSIKKTVPTEFRESHGATSSTATNYCVLKEVVDTKNLNENSKFIDVGCGKGRVLSYLVHEKAKCKAVGVELNEEVANIAKSWTKNYENLEVITGNVFDMDMSEYTDFCLSRPFEADAFKKFLNKIEDEAKQKVNVYLISDQFLGDYLDNREGWSIEKRGAIYSRKGFIIYQYPQRYSVCKYTPKDK